MTSIMERALLDRKRALIAWTLGLVALTAFTLAFYPAIKDNPQWNDLLEGIPEGLRTFIGEHSLTSPEGYLESQLFLYLIPLLFTTYAVGRSADAIAGEEQRRTLDLLLSTPVTRRRVALEKFGAVTIGVFLLASALTGTLYVGALLVDMDIGLGELATAASGAALLGLLFGAIALAIGAGTGKKGVAIGTAAALAVASYFLYSLAPVVDALEPYRKLSPFYYYWANSPLENGPDVAHFVVLLGALALLLFVAVLRFDRRDVGV